MTQPEKIKAPTADKTKSKTILEDKKIIEQNKKFRAEMLHPSNKTELAKTAKPPKSKLDAKNRHDNCVDEEEHRAEIAQYLLALGLYPNAKSAYEKVINAQTEYLANAVKTGTPSMNSVLFP